jgi:hypothetical protein
MPGNGTDYAELRNALSKFVAAGTGVDHNLNAYAREAR